MQTSVKGKTMKTPNETKPIFDGVQLIYRYPNGYGASVVSFYGSYGGSQGLWELAVLDHEGNITYDTPITNDVEGYLTNDEVDELLERIERLDNDA